MEIILRKSVIVIVYKSSISITGEKIIRQTDMC